MNIFINHPSPYLTDCDPHGDGLIAYQYIDGLARRGHRLWVAAPVVKLSKPLHPNVTLTIVPGSSKTSGLDESRRRRIVYALRVRRHMQQLQRDIHFDVVHQLNPGTSWVHLFLPLRRIPLVVGPVPAPWPEAARPEPNGWKHSLRVRLREIVRRELLGKARTILVPVASAQAHLGTAGQHKDKVELLPYGIDSDLFCPHNSLTGNEQTRQRPKILFLANLEERKGIHTLLRAFRIVAERMPEAELTIAGDGSERHRVEQEIARMPQLNRIRMIGRVPRSSIADVIRSCTIYCLPSHGEPFGMSALEAMACGKPVIATAYGGLDDLVDSAGGVKVAPGDAQELAEAILYLAARPDLCLRMGEYNRSLVVRFYEWNNVLHRLEGVYERAIA